MQKAWERDVFLVSVSKLGDEILYYSCMERSCKFTGVEFDYGCAFLDS